MRTRIFLLAFIVFAQLTSCAILSNSKELDIGNMSDELSNISFNEDVAIILPIVYDDNTSNFSSSSCEYEYSENPKSYLRITNSFSKWQETRVGFTLYLKAGVEFESLGSDGILLFRLDKENQIWEAVSFSYDPRTSIWTKGTRFKSVCQNDMFCNHCHSQFGEPILIYPEIEDFYTDDLFRLVIWGKNEKKSIFNSSPEFIGAYVDFILTGEDESTTIDSVLSAEYDEYDYDPELLDLSVVYDFTYPYLEELEPSDRKEITLVLEYNGDGEFISKNDIEIKMKNLNSGTWFELSYEVSEILGSEIVLFSEPPYTTCERCVVHSEVLPVIGSQKSLIPRIDENGKYLLFQVYAVTPNNFHEEGEIVVILKGEETALDNSSRKLWTYAVFHFEGE